MTLSCFPNVAPKSPTFFCVRLFAAFNISFQLLLHSFLILLEQSVYPILFNSLSMLLMLVALAASFVLALLELHLILSSSFYICVLLLCISLSFKFLHVSFALRF